MRKRAIRLRHFMCVLALFYRVALPSGGVSNLLRERFGHRHSFAIVRVLDDPAHGERNLPRGHHFHRHLIRRASNPTRFHLKAGPNVIESLI
jgi:hypothetical protein